MATLDNNLSEFLDLQGKVPMTDRGYLDKVCGVSKLTEAIREVPFLKGHFTDKITVSYDSAKAFVVAQQDMAKMVDTLVKELDESGDPGKADQSVPYSQGRNSSEPLGRTSVYSEYARELSGSNGWH